MFQRIQNTRKVGMRLKVTVGLPYFLDKILPKSSQNSWWCHISFNRLGHWSTEEVNKIEHSHTVSWGWLNSGSLMTNQCPNCHPKLEVWKKAGRGFHKTEHLLPYFVFLFCFNLTRTVSKVHFWWISYSRWDLLFKWKSQKTCKWGPCHGGVYNLTKLKRINLCVKTKEDTTWTVASC